MLIYRRSIRLLAAVGAISSSSPLACTTQSAGRWPERILPGKDGTKSLGSLLEEEFSTANQCIGGPQKRVRKKGRKRVTVILSNIPKVLHESGTALPLNEEALKVDGMSVHNLFATVLEKGTDSVGAIRKDDPTKRLSPFSGAIPFPIPEKGDAKLQHSFTCDAVLRAAVEAQVKFRNNELTTGLKAGNEVQKQVVLVSGTIRSPFYTALTTSSTPARQLVSHFHLYLHYANHQDLVDKKLEYVAQIRGAAIFHGKQNKVDTEFDFTSSIDESGGFASLTANAQGGNEVRFDRTRSTRIENYAVYLFARSAGTTSPNDPILNAGPSDATLPAQRPTPIALVGNAAGEPGPTEPGPGAGTLEAGKSVPQCRPATDWQITYCDLPTPVETRDKIQKLALVVPEFPNGQAIRDGEQLAHTVEITGVPQVLCKKQVWAATLDSGVTIEKAVPSGTELLPVCTFHNVFHAPQDIVKSTGERDFSLSYALNQQKQILQVANRTLPVKFEATAKLTVSPDLLAYPAAFSGENGERGQTMGARGVRWKGQILLGRASRLQKDRPVAVEWPAEVCNGKLTNVTVDPKLLRDADGLSFDLETQVPLGPEQERVLGETQSCTIPLTLKLPVKGKTIDRPASIVIKLPKAIEKERTVILPRTEDPAPSPE